MFDVQDAIFVWVFLLAGLLFLFSVLAILADVLDSLPSFRKILNRIRSK